MKDEQVEQIASDIKSELDLYNKGVALELMDERKKLSVFQSKRVFCLESTLKNGISYS